MKGKLVNIIIILLTISPFLFSCKKDKAKMDFVEINIEQNVKNLKHFNICDFDCDLRYVSLESNSLFLKAAALYDFSKDYFVVSDRTICLLYDWQGNFISQIGRMGKGPGEYLRVSHVQFGPDQNIYTNDGRSISVYDFGGRFKRIFKPESNPDKLVLGGNVLIFALLNDTVFRITDNFQFEPIYHINLGRLKMPDEIRNLPLMESYHERQKYLAVGSVFETSEFLFLFFYLDNSTILSSIICIFSDHSIISNETIT